MNNRDDADQTPDDGPRSEPPTEGAETPAVPDNPAVPDDAAGDEHNSDTDQFPPVVPGPAPEAYSEGRQDTAQLEVPPDGFEPYSDGRPGYGQPLNEPPSPNDPSAGPIAPQRPKRRTGMIITLIALSVVLLLVIAGVGSELYIRSKAKDCLEQSFGDLTGASTSVSLSKRPMLLQWASGTVPYVQVDTSDEGDSAMRLHARGDDIESGDNSTKIGELQGSGYVPFGRIMELAQPQETTTEQTTPDSGGGLAGLLGSLGGGMAVDSVTGNAAAGTITIATSFQLIFTIPAEVEIKPVVDNGKLAFEVVQASAIGLGVPADWAQVLVDQVSAGLFPPLFDQLNFEQLTVSDQGVEFAVAGSDITLDQESVGSQSGSQETCTVI